MNNDSKEDSTMNTGTNEEYYGTDNWSSAVKKIKRKRTFFERIVAKLKCALPGPIAKLQQADPDEKIKQELNRFAEANRDVVFLQIGSCDAMAGDPLRELVTKFNWRGFVVEPVPENFERLKTTYKDFPNVTCRNIAVASENGRRTFYYIDAPEGVELPEWARQIGSLVRSHVEKHSLLQEGIDKYINEIEVETMDPQTLVKSSNNGNIDLLHTDLEGYDLEVLKQIDFATFKPRLILYEDFHMSEKEREEAFQILQPAGYKFIQGGMDVLAILEQNSKS